MNEELQAKAPSKKPLTLQTKEHMPYAGVPIDLCSHFSHRDMPNQTRARVGNKLLLASFTSREESMQPAQKGIHLLADQHEP